MSVNINSINPYIRRARDSTIYVGTDGPARALFDYELIYLEQGDFVLNYNNRDFHCTDGCFILIRPGVSHRFTNITKHLHQPHIHFDVVYTSLSPQIVVSSKDIPSFTEDEKSLLQKDVFSEYDPDSPFITFKNPQKAIGLLYEIIENSEDEINLLCKAKMTELIHLIATDNFPRAISYTNNINIALRLKNHFDLHQGLTSDLNQLAKIFSYSKYALERQFKKQFGVSLISYRNNKRMELAKLLLENMSVSAVAEALGFASIYSFSRTFKNHFGVSPKASTKKNKK